MKDRRKSDGIRSSNLCFERGRAFGFYEGGALMCLYGMFMSKGSHKL